MTQELIRAMTPSTTPIGGRRTWYTYRLVVSRFRRVAVLRGSVPPTGRRVPLRGDRYAGARWETDNRRQVHECEFAEPIRAVSSRVRQSPEDPARPLQRVGHLPPTLHLLKRASPG